MAPAAKRYLLRAVIILAFLSCVPLLRAQPDSQWVLDQATLSYHVSHILLPDFDGVGREVKGKGICRAAQCDFIIIAQIGSFDSGDSDRDRKFLNAVRAEQYPLIVITARFPEPEVGSTWIHPHLDVQLAGQIVHFSQTHFQREAKGNAVRITGNIPLTCSAFKIDRPTFLTVPIRDQIPVHIDMTWHLK